MNSSWISFWDTCKNPMHFGGAACGIKNLQWMTLWFPSQCYLQYMVWEKIQGWRLTFRKLAYSVVCFGTSFFLKLSVFPLLACFLNCVVWNSLTAFSSDHLLSVSLKKNNVTVIYLRLTKLSSNPEKVERWRRKMCKKLYDGPKTSCPWEKTNWLCARGYVLMKMLKLSVHFLVSVLSQGDKICRVNLKKMS